MAATAISFDLGPAITAKTFTELERYAGDQGLHVEILDEQPVYDSALEEDRDCNAVVLLGDYIPGAAGTRDDMEEAEQYEHREVWVSQPVEECGPMNTSREALFSRMDEAHQSWHELADLAQETALELIN